ncbi:unnamed protein product [Gulo gulo]|uniref:Uncharacterized protein n=1 Tax=Gulo gulo TaxID=48420 RepID=A0A9X9Q1W1_GULGU|nr:unnamed protein product [Gulo gulo]
MQEDDHSRGALQTGQWPRQDEWEPHGDDHARHAAVPAPGTCFMSGQGAICCGHPSPREGWWSRGSDLHNHNWPLHLQSPGGYYQKYMDEAAEKEIKDLHVRYNQTLQVAVSQCCESKKFDGPGACAYYRKSYR